MKKIQYIFTMIALAAILFHSGTYTAVYLDFQFNQSYIASTLCVNRFQPELKCEGKCYLKKQMRQQEQQTDSGVLTIQESLLWVHEADVIDIQHALAGTPAAPAAYYLSFFTQYSAIPWPHPPCKA